MGDISNKSLAALLVVAIVVSVAGTWMVVNQGTGMLGITGKQSSAEKTGEVEFTVETLCSVTTTDGLIDWGAGGVPTGATVYTLDSSTGDTGGAFTAESTGMVWTNYGSASTSVNLAFSNLLASDQGKFKVSACAGANPGAMATIANTTGVCTGVAAGGGTARVDMQVKVNASSAAGARSSIVTATFNC